MKIDRGNFVKSGLYAGIGSTLISGSCSPSKDDVSIENSDKYKHLDEVLAQPVLNSEYFKEPVIKEFCDQLEYKGNYMIRVRSKDGAKRMVYRILLPGKQVRS